jgi:hypothetical protein
MIIMIVILYCQVDLPAAMRAQGILSLQSWRTTAIASARARQTRTWSGSGPSACFWHQGMAEPWTRARLCGIGSLDKGDVTAC